MTTALVALTQKLAASLDMGDGTELLSTLKATAFKTETPPSDAQMTALLIIANQYKLNPWTKEIYAFPDSRNGIVPVVGVDGWARIINSHKAFDGMEFEQDDVSCTCIMYRKDRGHPIKVTEYMVECARPAMAPWKSHPYRMLRHKAMIQCARLAFGFGGIYDPDEAERIAEETQQPKDMGTAERVSKAAEPKFYPAEEFEKNLAIWSKSKAEGRRIHGPGMIAKVASAGTPFTAEQEKKVMEALGEPPQEKSEEPVTDVMPKDKPAATYAEVADKILLAESLQALDDTAGLISLIEDEAQRKELDEMYERRKGDFA